MKRYLKCLSAAITLPVKGLGLGLLCGILTWAVLDAFQARNLNQVLLEHTKEQLRDEAARNRMVFHRYLKQHAQLTKLIASYQPLTTWLAQRQDHMPASAFSRYEKERPDWFPPVSTWRGLIDPGYFLLHDAEGNLQAIYQLAANDLPLDSALQNLLATGRSEGQIHLTALGGHTHLITSSAVNDVRGRKLGRLTLVSRIDDEFVGKLRYATDASNVILALFEGAGKHLLASSRPERLIPGVRLEALQRDYVATGKPFFDYGSSELRLQLATLIPLDTMAALNASILDAAQNQHLIAAVAFTLSFTLLIFSWSRRIEGVLRHIHRFSRHVAGDSREFEVSGDALAQLESDLTRLRDEILEARESLGRQQQTLQQLKQLEVLETVADHLQIGVLLLGSEGGVELQTQQMGRFEKTLGAGAYRALIERSIQENELDLQDDLQNQYAFSVSRLSLFRQADVVLIRDVSHEKRLQRRLQERELQFHRITESARDGIVSIDHSGNVIYWNRAAAAMFQYSALDVMGKPVTCIIPESYREAHQSAIQRIGEAEVPYSVSKTLVLEGLRKDGSTFPVELALSNWQMDGTPYFAGIIRDITERKRAEQTLQESERYGRTLFEQSPIGLALCEVNGELVDCNLAYSTIVGRTPEEMTGLSYWELTPEEYADDEQRQLERLGTTGCYGPYEKEYLHKDGHRVPVRLHGRLLKRGGKTYIWSSVEDISETHAARRALQESESRFSLFMDHLPAAVFIKDSQSRVLYVNAYMKMNFFAGEWHGTDTAEHFSADVAKKIVSDDRRALGEGRYDLVERLKDRTGQERSFRTLKFAIPQSEGQPPLLGGIAWDITDALAASESLARSKRRYREIFEIAQEGIWLIDAEAHTVEVNQRMAEMLGYTMDEMRGRHVFELMDEQAREEAAVLLDRRRKGITEKYDFRFRTKAGADCWAIVSTVPMYDAQGDYAGALRMVTDITERKRAEEALRDHEQQLRLILASTGEGIFGLDLQGRCTFANRACIELLGFTDEEDLLGKRMHELIHHTRHDGTDYPVEECPTYRSCTLRDVTFADDELLWRADGSAFHAEYQSAPLVRNGAVLGAVVSFADITERKLAAVAIKEERDFAEQLIETAPVIVLVLDPEGNIIRFNSFMEKLSGYSLAEVMGKNWFETFPIERGACQISDVLARIEDKGQTRGDLHAIATRDGEERLIAWYNTTLRDSDGRLTAVLAIGHDVTDQKAKEAQLLQAQKMEVVGQLTGGIAHDFNNLLTVILGNLGLLAKTIGYDREPELSDFLRDMKSAAKDGAELTQRLLAFSRREPLQQKRIDLPAFLGHFRRFLQRTLGADVEVQVQAEETIDQLVSDPPQLESALLNLALNARDAMPHGGRLSLQVESKEAAELDPTLKPGTYVEIAVMDTGEGMTLEQLSHAIEPFYTTKGSGQGSGLGLSMVFGFCKQAGGIFRLTSEPGVGTQATIVLPLVGVVGEEVAQAPESALEAPEIKGTVLVVEDEGRVRKLAGRFLKDLGYDVLMVENGEKAIEVLQSELAIDLVFSDIVVPGKTSGCDLYRWVQAHRPEVKALLTTGLKSAELDELTENDAAPEPIVLPKPYTKEQLAEAIRDVLNT
ncbi:MAG: PAS domain S-box protein [Chromatiaceae bacterium]|nr:PAS domain S-box protein [Chromatiaceae bacterium]